jgi:hypothetical protein
VYPNPAAYREQLIRFAELNHSSYNEVYLASSFHFHCSWSLFISKERQLSYILSQPFNMVLYFLTHVLSNMTMSAAGLAS